MYPTQQQPESKYLKIMTQFFPFYMKFCSNISNNCFLFESDL